jgi:uncharacterized protein
MSKNSEKSPNSFNFELTTTQACNFNCEYCFEHDCEYPTENIITKNLDIVIRKMKDLFNDFWFQSEFETKKINFWGGEPSLNMNFIEKVVEEFIDDESISFFIFTNGSKIKELLPTILKFKGRKNKFNVQISYDGEPVNDRRKTKQGTFSSSIVFDAMELLYQNDIRFQTKSTICYYDFHHLPEVWDHFKVLKERYKDIFYALTIDYHHVEFEKYKKDIEDSLLKVAKREIEFFKENKRFLSNIFSAKKKHCQCGKQMLTIDVDGKAYYCHGCLYSKNKDDFSFSSIDDEDFVKKVRKNYDIFYDSHPVIDECENCAALSCLRCNVTKYDHSNKKDFNSRWYDYTSQEDLCKYYILAGKIGRAMLNILKEE